MTPVEDKIIKHVWQNPGITRWDILKDLQYTIDPEFNAQHTGDPGGMAIRHHACQVIFTSVERLVNTDRLTKRWTGNSYEYRVR